MLSPKRYLNLVGLVVAMLLTAAGFAVAAYQIAPLSPAEWQGTAADRLQPEVPGQYQFDYGDETSLTFNLPWAFPFYGANYSQLTADADGNIWFATPGGGPRIAAWNADLNSYYVGAVFIEHQTSPERVVVQWLTETTEQAGYGRSNSFEAVLFADGTIQLNYQTIAPFSSVSQNSGITDGANWLYLPTGAAILSGTSFEIGHDTDGDGIEGGTDNCPDVANPDQADTDDDGSGDLCDEDDDNDSYPDISDAFPLDPGEWLDTDGDSLGNNADPDDDNDGLPDSWEQNYGLDPLNSGDAAQDPDGDGLTNLQEYGASSSPILFDTDGDGLPDGWEVAYGFNPVSADTDNDGIADGAEDSDGDGLSNLQEYRLGTNPLLSDTDDDGITDLNEYVGTIMVPITNYLLSD